MEEPAVYEIDVNKKYILQIERPLTADARAALLARLSRWVKSTDPIFVIDGANVKLVRVEAEDENQL